MDKRRTFDCIGETRMKGDEHFHHWAMDEAKQCNNEKDLFNALKEFCNFGTEDLEELHIHIKVEYDEDTEREDNDSQG